MDLNKSMVTMKWQKVGKKFMNLRYIILGCKVVKGNTCTISENNKTKWK